MVLFLTCCYFVDFVFQVDQGVEAGGCKNPTASQIDSESSKSTLRIIKLDLVPSLYSKVPCSTYPKTMGQKFSSWKHSRKEKRIAKEREEELKRKNKLHQQ